MEKDTNNKTGNNTTATEANNEFQLSDIIAWVLCHKAFFAVSVVVCMAIGAFYAARTQASYQRSASVMLRSDQSGQAQINELAAFADLGIGSTGLDVYNEIQAFKSPMLMLDVVTRLGININYTSKNWIGHVTDWYDKSPVTVSFKSLPQKIGEADLRTVTFTVEKTSDGKLRVSDMKMNGLEQAFSPQTVAPGKDLRTPAGVVAIDATKYFNRNFEDEVNVTYVRPDIMAKGNMARLSVELADKYSTVINLSYTDPSPKRAEDVLNTLIDAYNEEWIRYTNKSTVNTAKFINERLQVIEKELGTVDSDIERFKSSNQLLDMTAETAQMTQESSKYSEQAFMANNQLAVARFIREYLVDNTRAYDLLPSNSGIGSATIEEQIAEYNKKLLDRQRLVSSSSDSNPVVADLNDQLRMMRSTILRSIDNHISTLKIQADRLAEQESLIAGRISSGPGKAKELLSIERQQKIKEELYLYLLQKREENELQASIVFNNTRLLKPATGDDAPVSPKKSVIYAASFILGLAIPFCYMLLVSKLNTKVRNKKDLESLSAPILGDIPLASKAAKISWLKRLMPDKDTDDGVPEITVSPHNRNSINEAFRVVRTNLDFMKGERKQAEAILVTSYYPGSGKSFTTANLATVFALRDKRVAIVDLDIRKATFSKLARSPRKGVCTYLNGMCELDEIVVRAETSGLKFDVIPCGAIAPNPTELLVSERLESLVASLKESYDYILMDTPPIPLVADTSIISRVADRTIFIVRAGIMDRRMLPEVESIYREGHYKNMSVLLNGCADQSKKYFGYGHHGYGYGYGN